MKFCIRSVILYICTCQWHGGSCYTFTSGDIWKCYLHKSSPQKRSKASKRSFALFLKRILRLCVGALLAQQRTHWWGLLHILPCLGNYLPKNMHRLYPALHDTCLHLHFPCMHARLCVCVCVNEWVNESVNEWINERTTEGMHEWMHEWLHEWMNECMHAWMNACMRACVGLFLSFSLSLSLSRSLPPSLPPSLPCICVTSVGM